MTGIYILLGGIAFFAGLLTLVDGIEYRRKQQGRDSR